MIKNVINNVYHGDNYNKRGNKTMKNTTKKYIIAATTLAVTVPTLSGAIIASAQTPSENNQSITSTESKESSKDGEVKNLPETPVTEVDSNKENKKQEQKPIEKPSDTGEKTEEKQVPNDKVTMNVPKYNTNGIPMIEPGKVQTVLPSPSYNEKTFDKTLKFSIPNHKYGTYFAIDAKTGIITVTLPPDYIKTSGNTKINLPVNITQEVTGTTIQSVVTMNLGNQKQDFEGHHYNEGKTIKVLPGQPKTVSPITKSDKTPEIINAKLKEAYENVTINNKNGELTIKTPKDAKPGSYKGTVELYYKDSFMKTADFTYEIVSPGNYYNFFYNDNNVFSLTPGETLTISPTFDKESGQLPEGTKYVLAKNDKNYATINEMTGELVIKVPKEAGIGEESLITITATLPDGSTITKENTLKIITKEEKEQKDKEKEKNISTTPTDNKQDNKRNDITPITQNKQKEESLAVTGSNIAIMLGILAGITAIGGIGYFGYTRTREKES